MTRLGTGADGEAKLGSSGTRGVRASGHVLERHGRGFGRWQALHLDGLRLHACAQ